mgnify:CR=1 FL=1|jgi:hypothetical protein
MTGARPWIRLVLFAASVFGFAASSQGQNTQAMFLAWTSGGLPDGFAKTMRETPGVSAVTVVRAGNLGLVRAWTATGVEVYQSQSGYSVPLETMVLDLASYGPFIPTDQADLFANLGPTEVLLGSAAAQFRGIGAGGRLKMLDGTQLTVRAVVDDALIGGGELALAMTSPVAELIPVDRYLLALYLGPRTIFDAAADAAARDQPVRVRKQGEAPFLRHADAVSPQIVIKQVFGEFFFQAQSNGAINREAVWVERNIVLADVPLLGKLKCHRVLIPLLVGAMEQLIAEGLDFLIDPDAFRGCDNGRMIGGTRSLSRHSWGAAVDLNYLLDIAADPRLIRVMERWGFTSGHSWLISDPGHFEYVGPPQTGG